MYMLKVDGVELPTPSSYIPGIREISKAERNARGTMIKEQIALKDTLDIKWNALTQAEMNKLVNVKRKESFMLEFISLEGVRVTGRFYAGDLTANAMDFKDGKVTRWLDVTMNFIEM